MVEVYILENSGHLLVIKSNKQTKIFLFLFIMFIHQIKQKGVFIIGYEYIKCVNQYF